MMRPLATFSFFIFLTTFFIFFTLLVPPSSPSLLPPCPSFLLVPPSSSSLLPPHPTLFKSLRIRKSPFFIDFDETIIDRPTDGSTDKASYKDADASKKRVGNDPDEG